MRVVCCLTTRPQFCEGRAQLGVQLGVTVDVRWSKAGTPGPSRLVTFSALGRACPKRAQLFDHLTSLHVAPGDSGDSGARKGGCRGPWDREVVFGSSQDLGI